MKEYDVVIFGATGFTGQWVVREFNSYATDLKWAIVGRNEGRLERVKTENNLNADILIADISVDETVENVCKNAKLVVNCTGPYRLLGETVVENCVKSGSDYLDLCGEPEFIEAMEMKVNIIFLGITGKMFLGVAYIRNFSSAVKFLPNEV